MNVPLSTVLIRLSEAVGNASSLSDLYTAALAGMREATGVDRASILLFDADGVMRFKAWSGISHRYRAAVEGHSPWTPDGPPSDPIVVPDVRLDPALSAYLDVFEQEQIVALAFIPVVSRRRVIGKFMLYRDTPGGFADGELSTSLAIAYQIGFAVERTRRELDHDQHHQRLMFALDAAQMGSWEWDIPGQRVRWSENLERMHGLAPGSFTGEFEAYEREIHPEDRERVRTSLERAVREGAVHDVEYRIVAPDGTVRWMLAKGRVERDVTDRPVRMTGVCMDVSARKRAELDMAQALRQEAATHERLAILTDGAQRLLTLRDRRSVVDEVLWLARAVVAADGYAVWRRREATWRIVASHGLSRAFTDVDLVQHEPIELTSPVVADDVRHATLLEGRRAAYVEEGIASLFLIPLPILGEPGGSIVFYFRSPHRPTDMDLRVSTTLGQLAAAAISNAELYAQQQRLRREAEDAETRATFLAEASALLSSLDYERNLRRLSNLAVPRLGDWCAIDLLTEKNVVSRLAVTHNDPRQVTLVEEIHQRYPIRLDDATGVGRVLRTGEPEMHADVTDDLMVASARDDEHLRLIRELALQSVMIVPLSVGDRTFGAITLVTTAGGRRYASSDLTFAAELARRAAFAVENARLYRDAHEANRLKDEFLATLSHELRTPLNVILGRAHMLAGAAADPGLLTHTVDTIERNGRALATLVEDLLDVSRITLGQVKLDLQLVDMRAIVEAAAAGVEPAARAKGTALVVEADPDVPPVLADGTRLQQVVWNLLTNALKFTPPGGRIAVAIRRDDGRAALSVSDTGEGIPPAFLPYVFEIFRQGEATTNRRHGGLGLGLSIVRQLVELHGGTVTAESAGLGLGATFRVRLPCAAAPLAASDPHVEGAVGPPR